MTHPFQPQFPPSPSPGLATAWAAEILSVSTFFFPTRGKYNAFWSLQKLYYSPSYSIFNLLGDEISRSQNGKAVLKLLIQQCFVIKPEA